MKKRVFVQALSTVNNVSTMRKGKSVREKDRKEHIVIYEEKFGKWKLATKELSTYGHSEKIAAQYEVHDKRIKIVCIEYLRGINDTLERVTS